MKDRRIMVQVGAEEVERHKVYFIPNESDTKAVDKYGKESTVKVFKTVDGVQYWRDKNGTIRRIKPNQLTGGK